MKHRYRKTCLHALLTTILLVVLSDRHALGDNFIVKNGNARARIVIAKDPPRMTRLAAEELQTCLEKITGARLPITDAPSNSLPSTIYVGKSEYTDRLQITDEGLEHGAYRIVSGDQWLVLLGVDRDFVPPEPYARNGGTSEQARVVREWDALTGGMWNNPVGGSIYRGYSKTMGIWHNDQHGSMNAVHSFLHDLGVRWYMPGELGEIIPALKTIALPEVDKVVHPDFPLRLFYLASYFSSPREDIMWYLRLGLNHGSNLRRHYFTHGMRDVTGRPEMKAAHPEYYALKGTRRDNAPGEKNCNQCLSSEGFFRENVRFVRAIFDIYNLPMISVMPSDGYQMCQCELCKDKIDINRDRAGQISDYVWGYVNRVAKELYPTHPDRKISCSAYANYTLPPTHIDKLSPNIVVAFTHGRGKHFTDPAVRREKEQLWQLWLEKSSNPLVINEHYVFTHRGTFLPVYFPHAIAAGLQALKGKSMGETVETAIGPGNVRGHGLHRPGFNHLNLYVTARLYWDADQDVDALLDEYYRLFYGPAAKSMKAFIEYSESNWSEMNDDVVRIDKVLELLAAARRKAPVDSPYAERIALIADYLTPLHNLRKQLTTGRDNAPKIRIPWRRGQEGQITVDGKLDEDVWETVFAYRLRDDSSGVKPEHETRFRMFWVGDRIGGALCAGIRCDDRDMTHLNIATRRNEDTHIWNGDLIEMVLETQSHAHYQLAVNPAAALVDLDRKGGKLGYDWSSQAVVAAYIGDGYWSVEALIPVTGTDTTADPLNGVVGRRPSEAYPWYVNVYRQRTRDGKTESFAFSPTGESNFHDRMKFAKLYVR